MLASVPIGKVDSLRQQATAAGVAVTEIGTIVPGKGEARLLGSGGKPLVLCATFVQPFLSGWADCRQANPPLPL